MQPPWPGRPVPPNDAKAVAALVLGILCLVGTFCWLGAPLGIPAVILGALALRDVRRSDGMLGGGGMAVAGVVLGSLGTLVFGGWVAFLVFAFVKATPTTPTPMVPVPPVAVTPPTGVKPPPLVPPGGWGRIHVVVLHPSTAKPLRGLLLDEVHTAKLAGETVLVETITPACGACSEISRAMTEPELQTSLASVRVVHVDLDEFGPEAASLRLSTPGLPWFYLLDARGLPRDAISADEWDDNDASEIAPVLDAFLAGKLKARRSAWGTTL